MDIELEDKIDDYLLGRMSEAERISFEEMMADDGVLRDVVELRREIVAAIKRRKIKKALATEERRIAFRRKIWIYSSSVMLAACLVIGVVLRVSSVNRCISLSDEFYSSIVFRGGDDVFSSLSSMLDAGEYKRLREYIFEQLPLLQKEYDGYATEGLSEKEQYDKDMVRVKIDELEWMEAVSYMKQGKVMKARKALEKISSGSGVYSEDASRILGLL